jgi:putative restriction endonuclease
MTSPEQWLAKLAKLRHDKAGGDPAPHKPLLLLVILELAEQGLLPDYQLPLSPELAFRFCTYWGIVAHRRKQRPDVRYPFHHLKTARVWVPLGADGRPSPDRLHTRSASLDGDFVTFARSPTYREQARRILIATYFEPGERAALYELVGLPIPSADQIARDANYQSPEQSAKQGREARFRINIVAAYNYTCALTGYRLATVSGGSIVDAAHIHQFADSRNNDPQNGLALCKNAHWLFDNGLWSLTDDYTVIVADGEFAEDGPDQMLLRAYAGSKIRLPKDARLWPSPRHLTWHREHQFRGAEGSLSLG